VTAAPLVSIGVPVYNGAHFLARSLESLLAQTYPHLEIIICDNASTDATSAIGVEFSTRDSRVRYVRNDANIGANPNFLKALALASGKYFTWTAADDVRPPDSIEACVRALEASPDAVMAHGPIALELPRENNRTARVDNRVDMTSDRPSRRVRQFTSEIMHNACMFGLHRRDVLSSVECGYRVGWDFLVCLQMSQRGPVAWVAPPIIVYRHQWGAVDNPMYARIPLALRDLLLLRGAQRRKCWLVLGAGSYYLWRLGARDGMAERVKTVWAFATAFVARFRPELAKEPVFMLFTPASWIALSIRGWVKRALRPTASVS
jgi:glycosyltransferase involved in cell wall biosynthesis